jgi:hypothetical protein
MSKFMNIILTAGVLALSASPAHAFFEQMIAGMTSVTNNLIDSSENLAVHGMNTTSTTILVLSNDIGKMADRINVMADKIGVMADRIGVMADRIVTTERMMNDFAHKLVDTGADLARGRPAPGMETSRQPLTAQSIQWTQPLPGQAAANFGIQCVPPGGPATGVC